MKQWLEMEIGITGGEEDGVVSTSHTTTLKEITDGFRRTTKTLMFVVFHTVIRCQARILRLP